MSKCLLTDQSHNNLKYRITGIYAILTIFNLISWCLAYYFFSGQPKLMALAFLAYGFGLRHAVDADHIAAIDNVTRKISTGK